MTVKQYTIYVDCIYTKFRDKLLVLSQRPMMSLMIFVRLRKLVRSNRLMNDDD